jgi:hypothetical protein
MRHPQQKLERKNKVSGEYVKNAENINDKLVKNAAYSK